MDNMYCRFYIIDVHYSVLITCVVDLTIIHVHYSIWITCTLDYT